AERLAAERRATIVQARALEPGLVLRAPGAFQRRNFALARAVAESFLELTGVAVSNAAIAEAGAATAIPGRMQTIAHDPPTLLDGAHNPDAIAALAEALAQSPAKAPLALVLGVLEDKDAASMLATLLPLCARVWFTAPPSSRALSPAALQSLARQLGYEAVECEPNAPRALAAAQAWARAEGGSVLATGSVYLVGELLEAGGAVAAGTADLLRSYAG
nr:bifunctional folylpolyglutamate synthase/dihydrofolate synthase [Solirubrobacterales bacterium]